MNKDELEIKISQYVDGELPEEESTELLRYLDTHLEGKKYLENNKKLKEVFTSISFKTPDDGNFDEYWSSVSNRLSKGFGWFFLVIGVIANIIYGLYTFAISDTVNPVEKILTFLVISGILLLLGSVAHQRYIEYKTDKYKDIYK